MMSCVNSNAMHVKQMKVQRKMERCNGTMMTKKEQREIIVTHTKTPLASCKREDYIKKLTPSFTVKGVIPATIIGGLPRS